MNDRQHPDFITILSMIIGSVPGWTWAFLAHTFEAVVIACLCTAATFFVGRFLNHRYPKP